MSKAIKGTDGAIRVTIPKDLCAAYNVFDGDEIVFFVNGHGINAQVGDIVLRVDHRGRG